MADFGYIIGVTGDCQNVGVGAFSMNFTGGTPPYTVEFILPVYPSQTVYSDTEKVLLTNLFSGVYQTRVNDSTLPQNDEFYINVPVSSGVCCSIVSVLNTTCGLNNGSVTGTSTSLYSSTNYLLYQSNGSFVNSATTNQSTIIFSNLTAGTYYMTVEDLGGCTGKSQTFIVENSPQTNYGLYAVPNSSCGGSPIGKIMVTGLTGEAPFTYLWSNGQTGTTATGLTEGTYSVQVTDGYGCVTTKSANITNVDPLGLGIFTAIPPSCLQSNGSISLTITGGSAPYYYSASTGDVLISYSQTYTLTGLSAGNYQFLITDAGLCTTLLATTLATPNGMSSVNVVANNSNCSSSDGSIEVTVVGGQSPFTYTLIGTLGNQNVVSGTQQIQTFNNLSADTYTVYVEDSSGCEYNTQVIILASNKFTLTTQITGTTCNQNNGGVTITCSSGYTLPLDFSVDGIQNVVDTNLTQVTFNNLSSGNHQVIVTDATGCQQIQTIFIPKGDSLDFSLYSVNCGTGNSGKITAFITSGTPPFIFDWSNNIPNNPQEIEVDSLSGGTYSLRVVDSNGCTLQRSTTISCNTNYTSYQSYVMGAEEFQIQSPTKLGLLQMLNEGYVDLTSGNTNCNLISAIFTAKVSVNPAELIGSETFFTATTLNNPPSDNLWYDTIQQLLLTIPGILNVIIDPINNQITISTNPQTNSLNGQEIIVELEIVYDIICLT